MITLFVASLSFETSRILLEAQRVLFLRTGIYPSSDKSADTKSLVDLEKSRNRRSCTVYTARTAVIRLSIST